MRYKCSEQGCFNVKMRPKIEVFSECFPGRINFGDVDAEVEINGFFLQLEWKSRGKNIPQGQAIKYRHYTKNKGWAVIVAVGCAESMEIVRTCVFYNGSQSEWTEHAPSDGLAYLQKKITAWALKAKTGGF